MAYSDVCYDKATKISMSEREHSVYLSCKKLEQLINEHFELKEKYMKLLNQWGEKDNLPLKFEELKEGMWVWDHICNGYVRISGIGRYPGNARLPFVTVYDSYINKRPFSENRFYRYEVKE